MSAAEHKANTGNNVISMKGITCPDADLHMAVFSQHYLPSITVSMEIGLFDFISSRPQGASLQEICTNVKLGNAGAKVLLGVVTCMGYLKVLGGKWFVTDVTQTFLTSSSTHYWNEYIYRPDNELHKRLKNALIKDYETGSHGAQITDSWSSGNLTREQALLACKRMHAHSLVNAYTLATSANFKELFGIESVLDLGGGSGVFAISLAIHQPGLKCTVGELPSVCDVVEKEYIANAEFPAGTEVVKTVPVNFFTQDIPSGYQSVFMSNILHDWNIPTCINLCKKIYDSLPAGGYILIYESMLNDDGCGPMRSILFSMHMFLFTEGQQFSLPELTDVLAQAGFERDSVTPRCVSDTYYLVSARKGT
eukprot:TRINITY_DN5527_c0_g1_i1.p1 TRINITY_DN5527_c0_g1~~TRINITY_DN5527_c0_g1_i1.p1  ORF type:complete len:365 (-),score=89.05 TRINITY_DN5527_c0_g1_i1:1015-2109(-)